MSILFILFIAYRDVKNYIEKREKQQQKEKDSILRKGLM